MKLLLLMSWLLCFCKISGQDVCLVNRTTMTFDCGFHIGDEINCTSCDDVTATINPPRAPSSCSIFLQDMYVLVKCEFDKYNNMIRHSIDVAINGSSTRIIDVTPYTSVKPIAIQHVTLESTRGNELVILGTLTDDLIPLSTQRWVNITVTEIVSSSDEPVFVNLTSFDSRINLNRTMTGLQPYTNYSVHISWRISSSNLWSETYTDYIVTKAKRPKAAPELLKGEYSYSLKNKTVLYWKPIPKSSVNGPGLEYIIYRITPNDGELYPFVSKFNIDSDLYNYSRTLFPDSIFNDSRTFLDPYLSQTFDESKLSGILKDFEFDDLVLIRANNSVNPSQYYSACIIRNSSIVRNPVVSLVYEQLNDTHNRLLWNLTDVTTIDKLHIYWCYGIWWQLEGWVECNDRIFNLTTDFNHAIINGQLLLLSSSSTLSFTSSSYSYIVETGDKQNNTCQHCFLHFGISTETSNISTPITWNTTLNRISTETSTISTPITWNTTLNMAVEKAKSQENYPSDIEIAVIFLGSAMALVFLIVCSVYIFRRCRGYFGKSYEIDLPESIQASSMEFYHASKSRTESDGDSGRGESLFEGISSDNCASSGVMDNYVKATFAKDTNDTVFDSQDSVAHIPNGDVPIKGTKDEIMLYKLSDRHSQETKTDSDEESDNSVCSLDDLQIDVDAFCSDHNIIVV